MDFLPAPKQRSWLLEQLRILSDDVGYQPLVCAPLLLPSARYFPDRWEGDLASAHRMLSRLHRYYALDDVSPSVVVFEHERFSRLELGATSEHHEGAAAYFAGIEDDRALYGVDAAQLEDPTGIAAAMAHEAAHAFRARFSLTRVEDDVETEERLTDLTTVFLGAGALTTAATERHESQSHGLLDGHTWTVRRLGYLSPVEMAFALAAVLEVRGRPRAEVRQIVEALGANQAKALHKSMAWLAKLEDLRPTLGVPADPGDWEPPFDLEDLTGPLADGEEPEVVYDDGGVDDGADGAGASGDAAPPQRVFAVRPGFETTRFFVMGMVAAVATVGGSMLEAPVVGLGVGLICAPLALRIQRRFGRRRCSETSCGAIIPAGAARCPGCGGMVCGVIDGYDARLAALEQLEDAEDSP